MDVITDQLEAPSQATSPLMLSSLDWRVWFLGYGCGGCFGLSLCVGIWSLIADENRSLGLMALAISLIHGFLIFVFWLRRSTMQARVATRVCYLFGSFGILLVALLMTSVESRVSGVASLYGLALMNFLFAFMLPVVTHAGSGRTK
jgi:hypothetical protein